MDKRSRVLAAYRVMDEQEGKDPPKAIMAWKSAQRVFQDYPQFADTNFALFEEGFRKLASLVAQCVWEPSADALGGGSNLPPAN